MIGKFKLKKNFPGQYEIIKALSDPEMPFESPHQETGRLDQIPFLS